MENPWYRAKDIIIDDYKNGIITDDMDAQHVYEMDVHKEVFKKVKWARFTENFRNLKKGGFNPSTGKRKGGSSSTKPGWITWDKSKPKCIIIEDLVQGIIPLEEREMSANDAWENVYKHMDEFKETCREQVTSRLKDHRKQIKKGLGRAKYEEECMEHDRKLFPRNETDDDGVLIFDLHPAKLLLRDDVIEKKHKTMKPKELWRSRAEYLQFDLDYFRQRIYQESRRSKFINWMEEKREENKLDACNIKRRLERAEAEEKRFERHQKATNKRQKDTS